MVPLQVLSTPGEKIVVTSTPSYRISYELKGDYLFLHSRIFNWSPGIYKELLSVMDSINMCARKDGYDYIYTLVHEDTIKFDTMFGFQVDTVYDVNGERIVLMKQATYGN